VLTADWGFEKRQTEIPFAKPPDRSPFGWRLEAAGVRAIYLPTWLRYRALSWNPAVKRFCRANLAKFDVAHIFGLYDLLGPAVAGFCRRRGIPYVLEPIGMFTPIVRSFRLKRLYHLLYGKKLFAGAAAVIATANQEAQELEQGGIATDKITLRRNGVIPPKLFPPRGGFRTANGISPDARLVLFLGRLSAKKDPELLLRAFASLPPAEYGRELRLVFIGPDEGGMKAHLQELAEKLKVSGRTRFLAPLFGDQKWAAYRDADVFVLPSQNENFGNAAVEAAVAGTPVILTQNCGVAPLLANVSAVVIPHEHGALVSALARLLRDRQLHAHLAAGGPEIAARLDWNEPIRLMETLYGKLAAARAADGKSERLG
jgi:glycosyltransferase involved in cell wall biosynthesis